MKASSSFDPRPARVAFAFSVLVLAATLVGLPVSTHGATVTATEDTEYAFAAPEFGFGAGDIKVTIKSLPSVGRLHYKDALFQAGSEISKADITAGHLTCMPERDGNGDAYTSFTSQTACTLARRLSGLGIGIVGGGTDTRMVLLDLTSLGIKGADAETVLASANITSNKNPVPFDTPRLSNRSALRLGDCIGMTAGNSLAEAAEPARPVVASICERFPLSS